MRYECWRPQQSIGDLQFGRQSRSTLISFAEFEVLFNGQEPGS